MKKKFEELTLDVQYFTANEYCVACGDLVTLRCNPYNYLWKLYKESNPDLNASFNQQEDIDLGGYYLARPGHDHNNNSDNPYKAVDKNKLEQGYMCSWNTSEKGWVWEENGTYHFSKIGDGGENQVFDKSTLTKAKS